MCVPAKLMKLQRPTCKWNIRDVCFVMLIVYGPILTAGQLAPPRSEEGVVFAIFWVCVTLLPIFVPIVWACRFCNAKPRDLGLTKGKWNIGTILGVGVATGIASACVALIARGESVDLRKTFMGICGMFIVMPTSATYLGVYMENFVLAPVGEEILCRGFLYPFFSSKTGVGPAIVLQSTTWVLLHMCPYVLTFLIHGTVSEFHWARYAEIFIGGIMLGVLCQSSRSLYPAMICHSIYSQIMTSCFYT